MTDETPNPRTAEASPWDPEHPWGRSRARFLRDLALDAAVEERGSGAMVTDEALVRRRHGARDGAAIERLIFEEDAFNRAMGDFDSDDDDGYAEGLGGAFARAYRAAAAAAGGQPVAAVGGIAAPEVVDGAEEDCYYAGQLLANLGIAESWVRDGEASVEARLTFGAQSALFGRARQGIWPDW